MPRGRKGPPQDSIDSILLAICRRDDIDSDTLSHYFDRLDDEWTAGAREKVLHLLRSNDTSAHAAAVLILSEIADDSDLEELEDFVTDPTVSDIAKLSLAPLLKELGSEMADDGIVPYLNDPTAAVQQMQMRLLELVGQSEMGVESILEDITSMSVERRLSFIGWLGSSNDPRAANLLIPLLENQSGKVVSAVIDALEQLGPVAIRQTIPALNYVVTSSANRSLKQYARAALGRLTMHALPGTEDAAMTSAYQQQWPPHEARASLIDGSGSQLIMLSWQRPDGLLKGVNVLYQDQWGIKDCYGIDEMERQRWDELVAELDEQGFGSFRLPFEYARKLVTEARSFNKRTRHKLPIAYAIWRPLIETDDLGKKKAVSMILEPRVLDADTLALAQHGDELYLIPEFMSWMYEPMDRIEPYIARYWATYNVFEASSSGKRVRGRKGKKEKEHQALLEELIKEAVGELVDTKWRLLYETRLRRQAALLHLAEREDDSALAMAVAAVLHPDSNVPVQNQPFLCAMMRLSIEQGPLRMMVESLGSSKLGPMPIDLLDGE